jgi:hypothetical protein
LSPIATCDLARATSGNNETGRLREFQTGVLAAGLNFCAAA